MDLPPSSWGRGGFAEVGLQPATAWVYPLLRAAEERLALAAAAYLDPQQLPELTRRLPNQAGRKRLLAQSSDWTFMLDAGSFPRYATDRINRRLEHGHTLLDLAAGAPARGQARSAAAAQARLMPPAACSSSSNQLRCCRLSATRCFNLAQRRGGNVGRESNAAVYISLNDNTCATAAQASQSANLQPHSILESA